MQQESFDPYRQWLGITTENRPPSHYELLNLNQFENDSAKISAAVDRQTSILQMVTGNDASLAERIINELKQVGECLLDSKSKSEYDAELKTQLDASTSWHAVSTPPQPRSEIQDFINEAGSELDEPVEEENAAVTDEFEGVGVIEEDANIVEAEQIDVGKISIKVGNDDVVKKDLDEEGVNKDEGEQIDFGKISINVGNQSVNVGNESVNVGNEPINIGNDTGESDVNEEMKIGDIASGSEGDSKLENDVADNVPPVPSFDLNVGQEKELPATDVSIDAEDSPDKMSSRIEAQKAKEQQDQNVKVILDRVMWISCGICVIAIAWVMTVRISGCNQEPTVVEKKEGDPKDAGINSQKISPQKKLGGSLLSPLEREERKRLEQEAARESKQNGNGSKGNSSNKLLNGIDSKTKQSNDPDFESIKETITFQDFNQPVNRNDLLSGLAPIRLAKVKWSKNKANGFLELDKNSSVIVDNEKAFNTLKKLTLLCRFKTNDSKRQQCLVSIKGKLVVVLDGKTIRYGVRGTEGTYQAPALADNKWHSIGVVSGQKTRLWFDGEFVAEIPQSLPEFDKVENESEIGNLSSAKGQEFVGQIDNIGMYWIELDENQIRSQLAR